MSNGKQEATMRWQWPVEVKQEQAAHAMRAAYERLGRALARLWDHDGYPMVALGAEVERAYEAVKSARKVVKRLAR